MVETFISRGEKFEPPGPHVRKGRQGVFVTIFFDSILMRGRSLLHIQIKIYTTITFPMRGTYITY
jgi:hypothetical protein